MRLITIKQGRANLINMKNIKYLSTGGYKNINPSDLNALLTMNHNKKNLPTLLKTLKFRKNNRKKRGGKTRKNKN